MLALNEREVKADGNARDSDAWQRQNATFTLKIACLTSEISFSFLYTRSTIRLARKQEK